jgi:hypothetical protein
MTLDAPNEEIVRTDVLLRIAGSDPDAEADPIRLADWSAPMTVGGPGGEVRLLEPTASWSPAGDGGVWLTPGDRYDIRRLDGSGKLLEVVRREEPRHAVTDELGRTLLAELVEAARDEMTSGMLDRAVLPDSLPATLGLWHAEPDGELWVGVVDPERPWDAEGANALDVFDAEGAYLGRLPMPADLRPTRVTADHVYGVWRDELDVPHARRFRIVR